MSTDELHLDELTLARAKRLAEERNVSVEEIVAKAIERFTVAPRSDNPTQDSMIGLFSDAPDLMDRVVEEAYQARERDPLRLKVE
jgi:hypothetical protein